MIQQPTPTLRRRTVFTYTVRKDTRSLLPLSIPRYNTMYSSSQVVWNKTHTPRQPTIIPEPSKDETGGHALQQKTDLYPTPYYQLLIVRVVSPMFLFRKLSPIRSPSHSGATRTNAPTGQVDPSLRSPWTRPNTLTPTQNVQNAYANY